MTLYWVVQQIVKPVGRAQYERHSLSRVGKVGEWLSAEHFDFRVCSRRRALVRKRQLYLACGAGWNVQRPGELVCPHQQSERWVVVHSGLQDVYLLMLGENFDTH